MRIGPWLLLAVLTAAAIASAGLCESAARPLVALDLPVTGGIGSTAAAVYEGLRASGQYDLWWVKVFEPSHAGRPVAAIAIDNSSPRTAEIKNLADYVNGGGGLVLLAGTSSQWRKDNRALLSALDVQIADLKSPTAALALRHHAITGGLNANVLPAVKVGLQSNTLDAVLTQGDEPVAMAGSVGKGRVVVLMDPLVTATDPNTTPEPDRVRLLSQALQWAAQRMTSVEGAGTVTGPGASSDQRAPVSGLAAKIVADLPVEPSWQEVAAAVAQSAEAIGLPVEPLAYKQDSRDLRQALADRPALLIISSYRAFTDAESCAVAEYVGCGGSLLVLGYGQDKTVKPLVALNRLLAEFGISMTYGRPAGNTELCDHPATKGVVALGAAPAGSSVWAFGQWPLARVQGQALASAHELDRGRLIVMDAATLLAPKVKEKPAAEDTSAGFKQLLQSEMRWLTGK